MTDPWSEVWNEGRWGCFTRPPAPPVVAPELLALVREAAHHVPTGSVPAVPLDAIVSKEGDPVEVIGLALVSGTRAEFRRRVLGDIDNWRPTGLLGQCIGPLNPVWGLSPLAIEAVTRT